MSLFEHIPEAPLDPIIGLNTLFKNDQSPQKVNLGVGAYRNNEGKPIVLSVVRKVEQQIVNSGKFDHEYLPIDGLPEFNALTSKLIFGDNHKVVAEKRVATVQSISGTGALRISAEFIATFFPPNTPIYIPDPTWGNHHTIFNYCKVPTKTYRYLERKTSSLDFEGLLADLKAAPDGAVILLHGCAHNPTGVDPSLDQWSKIADVIQAKKQFPLFDVAYQGFASGDLDRDAAAIRHFADRNLELIVTQSYAKNLGLYGQRIGACNIVCASANLVPVVVSQLKIIIRRNYSNPPLHGARIVATILGDKALFGEWVTELKEMSYRIKEMRQKLFDLLMEKKTPGDWTHILNQIGMFSYTGLSGAQVELLTKKHHIYLTKDGRISMPGLNTHNIEYVANAIHDAVTAAL
eukprot:TRINITY_DN840_c0_g1_i3.p1 TRINITY_DN840_c0_g1~~TRINITY_DN840_c0_g1_i3.p1  ORF type:complete len:406 (-),score=108.86 TRINITY_DN840_c0_g1_i3:120-1337(-)